MVIRRTRNIYVVKLPFLQLEVYQEHDQKEHQMHLSHISFQDHHKLWLYLQ